MKHSVTSNRSFAQYVHFNFGEIFCIKSPPCSPNSTGNRPLSTIFVRIYLLQNKAKAALPTRNLQCKCLRTLKPFFLLIFFLSRYDIVCSGKHITVSIILKININCITDFDYYNGHLCFECDQQLSPDNCDQVTLCDQDSVSFSEKHKSGLTQYQSI